MALAMEETPHSEQPCSDGWSHLRPVKDEVNNYYDHHQGLTLLKGVAKTINAIYQNTNHKTMALPDHRAIQYAFDAYDYANKTERLSSGSYQNVRQFYDEEKQAVLASSIYLKLRKTSALDGAHYNISAAEFIDLFQWGGDEFFNIFDIRDSKEITQFTINEKALYGLLASDWRSDQPVDAAETLLLMMGYWRGRSEYVTPELKNWASLAAHKNMREIVARRQHSELRNYIYNTAIHEAYGVMSDVCMNQMEWFMLAQIPFHSDPRTISNYRSKSFDKEQHDDYIDGLRELRLTHDVYEIAPYIAAGVKPQYVEKVIKNNIDMSIAALL